MVLAATLYTPDLPTGRRSERRPVMLDGTLRDAALKPHDVTISNLSRHGFAAMFPAQFAVDSVLRVGISGIGARQARVMWQHDAQHGCAFLEPLSADDLSAALVAETVVRAPFGDGLAVPDLAPELTDAPDERLPGWLRLTIVVALPAAMWSGVFVAGARLFRF